MIIADLRHALEQTRITPGLRKALDFLRETAGQDLPDGKIELDGTKVFVLVQSYQTVPQEAKVLCEAHRDYIDVQYMLRGCESMGWLPAVGLHARVGYDSSKEAWLTELPRDQVSFVRLDAGFLAILYPTDGHAPRVAAGAPAEVKKIVVKVSVER
jgi:biofilm protein TabA